MQEKKNRPILPASGSPCTGCGLSMSVCVQKANRMEENGGGFPVPRVEGETSMGRLFKR